jgi:hypothetical protein
MRRMIFAVAVGLIVPCTFVASQQSSNQQKEKPKSSEDMCPMHDAHMHGATPSTALNERGDKGMGFSQSTTTHHFLMKSDGGVIQVEANDPTDANNRDNIRMHLTHIAQAFAKGDFDIPMFVHDTVPPGVPEMKLLQETIKYSFAETPAGGRVILTTSDEAALEAIHKFLRFQIGEHKTGDPTDVR